MDWLWRLLARRYVDDMYIPRAFPAQAAPTRQVARSDSLYNPLTQMGNDSTDKTQVARPNTWYRPLDDEELRAMFNNNGIARRIVDILPSFACREGWEVKGADTGEEKRLQVRARVKEAMTLAQLYGGSAMLLVTVDDIPAGPYRDRPADWLTQPLELDRVHELQAIQVFDTFEASPLDESKDPSSPHYREPEFWSIGSHGFYATVHASRVIHFKGRMRIPSERWSRGTHGGVGYFNRQQNASYLQSVYDQIRHLAETMKAGAVLAQESQKSVYQIAGLDAIRAGDQAEDLLAKIRASQQLSSILSATVVGENDNFHHVAGTSSGFDALTEGQMAMLSFVTGIPRMVWFGDQPSGFSTDGDASWKGFRMTVNSYQEDRRPQLERLYQVMAVARARKNTIDPENPELVFAPLDEPTDLERAQARLVNAQADSIEVQSGVLSPDEVRQRYQSDDGYQVELAPLDPIDAEEAVMRAQLATAAKAPPIMPGNPGESGPPSKQPNGNTPVD